jgi:Flp pilus assembly pilin Flp
MPTVIGGGVMNRFGGFCSDERGAVTVDWVVLTAGIVILAVVVTPPIQTSLVALATDIGTMITSVGAYLPN